MSLSPGLLTLSIDGAKLTSAKFADTPEEAVDSQEKFRE